MNGIKTLIVDDEFSNRNLVKGLVEKLKPDYSVVGEASSAQEAFQQINQLQPDLVLLDIKMPGENGLELLKRFEDPSFEVVFITGFDEYAVQAFECHALDYILKPIDPQKFEKALEKIRLRFGSSVSNLDNLKRILSSYQSEEAIITRIPVHHKSKVVLLELNEIEYIKASNGCTIFVTTHNEEYTAAKKLAEYEFIIRRFPSFVQINRGTYINLNSIKSYSKGVDCFVTLKSDISFEISRRKKSEILALLHR